MSAVSPNPGGLRQLQQAVYDRLLAGPMFSTPPAVQLVQEYLSDFAKRVEANLAKGTGASVIIREPKWRAARNARGVITATLVCQIGERYAINQSAAGSRQAAADIALGITTALLWADDTRTSPWDTGTGWGPIVCLGAEPIDGDGATIVYDVTFESTRSI